MPLDFWETTSGLFSYPASLGSTVITCLAFLLCFYGPLYLTVTCSWCPTFASVSSAFWFDSGDMSCEPRILIRRSIPIGWFCPLRCTSRCISWTSCSRPSLCNDRCRFWSRQCSALPVDSPQAQFLDELVMAGKDQKYTNTVG